MRWPNQARGPGRPESGPLKIEPAKDRHGVKRQARDQGRAGFKSLKSSRVARVMVNDLAGGC